MLRKFIPHVKPQPDYSLLPETLGVDLNFIGHKIYDFFIHKQNHLDKIAKIKKLIDPADIRSARAYQKEIYLEYNALKQKQSRILRLLRFSLWRLIGKSGEKTVLIKFIAKQLKADQEALQKYIRDQGQSGSENFLSKILFLRDFTQSLAYFLKSKALNAQEETDKQEWGKTLYHLNHHPVFESRLKMGQAFYEKSINAFSIDHQKLSTFWEEINNGVLFNRRLKWTAIFLAVGVGSFTFYSKRHAIKEAFQKNEPTPFTVKPEEIKIEPKAESKIEPKIEPKKEIKIEPKKEFKQKEEIPKPINREPIPRQIPRPLERPKKLERPIPPAPAKEIPKPQEVKPETLKAIEKEMASSPKPNLPKAPDPDKFKEEFTKKTEELTKEQKKTVSFADRFIHYLNDLRDQVPGMGGKLLEQTLERLGIATKKHFGNFSYPYYANAIKGKLNPDGSAALLTDSSVEVNPSITKGTDLKDRSYKTLELFVDHGAFAQNAGRFEYELLADLNYRPNLEEIYIDNKAVSGVTLVRKGFNWVLSFAQPLSGTLKINLKRDNAVTELLLKHRDELLATPALNEKFFDVIVDHLKKIQTTQKKIEFLIEIKKTFYFYSTMNSLLQKRVDQNGFFKYLANHFVGDCDMLVHLDAYLLRKSGVPTAIVYGISADNGQLVSNSLHAWISYYDEQQKKFIDFESTANVVPNPYGAVRLKNPFTSDEFDQKEINFIDERNKELGDIQNQEKIVKQLFYYLFNKEKIKALEIKKQHEVKTDFFNQIKSNYENYLNASPQMIQQTLREMLKETESLKQMPRTQLLNKLVILRAIRNNPHFNVQEAFIFYQVLFQLEDLLNTPVLSEAKDLEKIVFERGDLDSKLRAILITSFVNTDFNHSDLHRIFQSDLLKRQELTQVRFGQQDSFIHIYPYQTGYIYFSNYQSSYIGPDKINLKFSPKSTADDVLKMIKVQFERAAASKNMQKMNDLYFDKNENQNGTLYDSLGSQILVSKEILQIKNIIKDQNWLTIYYLDNQKNPKTKKVYYDVNLLRAKKETGGFEFFNSSSRSRTVELHLMEGLYANSESPQGVRNIEQESDSIVGLIKALNLRMKTNDSQLNPRVLIMALKLAGVVSKEKVDQDLFEFLQKMKLNYKPYFMFLTPKDLTNLTNLINSHELLKTLQLLEMIYEFFKEDIHRHIFNQQYNMIKEKLQAVIPLLTDSEERSLDSFRYKLKHEVSYTKGLKNGIISFGPTLALTDIEKAFDDLNAEERSPNVKKYLNLKNILIDAWKKSRQNINPDENLKNAINQLSLQYQGSFSIVKAVNTLKGSIGADLKQITNVIMATGTINDFTSSLLAYYFLIEEPVRDNQYYELINALPFKNSQINTAVEINNKIREKRSRYTRSGSDTSNLSQQEIEKIKIMISALKNKNLINEINEKLEKELYQKIVNTFEYSNSATFLPFYQSLESITDKLKWKMNHAIQASTFESFSDLTLKVLLGTLLPKISGETNWQGRSLKELYWNNESIEQYQFEKTMHVEIQNWLDRGRVKKINSSNFSHYFDQTSLLGTYFSLASKHIDWWYRLFALISLAIVMGHQFIKRDKYRDIILWLINHGVKHGTTPGFKGLLYSLKKQKLPLLSDEQIVAVINEFNEKSKVKLNDLEKWILDLVRLIPKEETERDYLTRKEKAQKIFSLLTYPRNIFSIKKNSRGEKEKQLLTILDLLNNQDLSQNVNSLNQKLAEEIEKNGLTIKKSDVQKSIKVDFQNISRVKQKAQHYKNYFSQIKKMITTQNSQNYDSKTGREGSGSPEELRKFENGDDPRYIHHAASMRLPLDAIGQRQFIYKTAEHDQKEVSLYLSLEQNEIQESYEKVLFNVLGLRQENILINEIYIQDEKGVQKLKLNSNRDPVLVIKEFMESLYFSTKAGQTMTRDRLYQTPSLIDQEEKIMTALFKDVQWKEDSMPQDPIDLKKLNQSQQWKTIIDLSHQTQLTQPVPLVVQKEPAHKIFVIKEK